MTSRYSEFIEEYFQKGFSDIFVVGYSHEEERSGYQNEHTTETVVALQDGQYVQCTISLTVKFNPYRPGREMTIGQITVISEDRYHELARGESIVDTQEVREKMREKQRAQSVVQQASEELEKITPLCSGHRIPLIVRLNNKTGKPFWGCPRFPNCRVTRPFSYEQTRLYQITLRRVV